MSVKLLPRPNDIVHLTKQGYRVAETVQNRHIALKKSSKKYSTLPVLKRLNLIRNLTPKNSKAHNRMSQDVEFMKKLYKQEKNKKGSKKESKKSSKKGSKKQVKKSSKKSSKKNSRK
jgi:hypothetical protein